MTPHDDAPAVGRVMTDTPAERDELRERLADAAKFLRRCRGTEPVEFFEEHATACEEAAALLAPQEAREAWRSVTDSLPKPGADVIAGYRDTAGRWCSVRAVYAAARSVVCTCERDGDCFCEMDDTGESWWPEGWYEIADNAYDVNTWRIRGTVTHWMPLPERPQP